MKQDLAASKDSSPPRASGNGWLTAFVLRCLLSVFLIAVSVAVVMALGRAQRPPKKKTVDALLPVVEVGLVSEHSGGIDFKVDGVVIPFREVDAAAQVAGQVAFKSDNCRMGRTVKRDEVLLRIDPIDFELEVRRLEQELIQAKTNQHELTVEIAARDRQIELAKEDLEIKKREVARYESIDDPGVYSESELDSARLKELQARDAVQTEHDQLELLEARKDRLAAAVELMAAQLEKAQLDLSRTEIKAPISGVVTQEIAEEGSYVQRGGAVVRIQDTSCMEIRCSLQMREMHWLLRSAPESFVPENPRDAYHIPETSATVSFDVSGTTYRWQGSLSYFDGGSVDRLTRMIPCRVYVREPLKFEVENGSGKDGRDPAAIALMAGMFVKVTVHTAPNLSLVELPEVAIQPGNRVWTVATDGTKSQLHEVTVRIAQSLGDTVLVYVDGDGLNVGDQVVVSPLAAPVEGGTVEIVEAR
jgi:RND family efflux transporter MFP subunit